MSVNKNNKYHVFGTAFNRKAVQYSYKKRLWKENKIKLKGGVFSVLQCTNFTLFIYIQTKITEYLSQSHKVRLFKFLMTYKEISIK